MRPRLNSRGGLGLVWSRPLAVQLQWGRGRSVAEAHGQLRRDANRLA